MICAQCCGEMSKKWTPKSAVAVTDVSTVVWECGVCGCRLTQAEIKSSSTNKRKAQPDPSTIYNGST